MHTCLNSVFLFTGAANPPRPTPTLTANGKTTTATDVTWGIGLTWFCGDGLSDRTIGHGSASSCTLRVDLENDLVITMTRQTAGRNFRKYHPQFIQAVTSSIAP